MLSRLIARVPCAVFAAFWLSCAVAQSMPAPASSGTAAGAKRGFLWEARQGERRVFLLGTIHIGKPEFHPLSPDIVERLRQADAIAVEADLSEAARVAPVVQRLAYYADGAPGLDRRAPALRARIESFAAQNGLGAEVLLRMKPWMLGNTMIVMEAMRLGFNPAYATEAFLFEFARNHRKSLVEIESIDAQLRLFDSAPEAVQIAYLEQAFESIANGSNREEITRLVAAWDKRDAAQMERLLGEMQSAKGVAERFIVEQIIDARHPRMLAAIERFAASGKLHVVAVGALHYFGPNGLLERLRQRGFEVTPAP